jgi:hypothetical protein
MTDAPPTRRAAWRDAALALGAGAGISAVVALLGQAVALVLFLLRGATGSYEPYLRLGAIYLELVHHVDVAVRLEAAAGGRPLSIGLGIAVLLVTAAAVAALATAGARLARRTAGTAGLVVALAAGYAVVPFALAFAARGVLTPPVDLGIGASLHEMGVAAGSAFVLPFAIALAAAALGGIRAGVVSGASDDAVVADVVAGGVRAFLLASILSVAGVLVLASVRPSFVHAYGSVIAAPDGVRGRVLLAGHAALLLPNQAVWVLVPAMGACDEVVIDGSARPFLCYWRSPAELPVTVAADTGVVPGSSARSPSPAYLAFLLVPLVATVGGGVRAARQASTRRGRAVAGAVSGLVFAGIAAAAIALSRVDLDATGAFLGASTVRVSVGPELLRGTAMASAWGVAGGALGGLVARYVGGTGTINE